MPASTLHAAATVFDQTVVCTNLVKAGLPVFDVGAKPTGNPVVDANGKIRRPPPGFFAPTSMYVQTGDVYTLFLFSSQLSGYQLDRSRCSRTTLKLKLAPSGLPRALTSARTTRSSSAAAASAREIALRIQLVSDSLGVTVGAKLVIARAKTGKALVYVEWARNSVRSWASPACDSYLGTLP